MTEKTESRQMDRYEGALIGVAVGDALGAPLEFMDADEIQRKHGTVREMIGGGWLSVEPGEVTDDTQMTLAVAEGIAGAEKERKCYQRIGENFLRWYETNPKDMGNICAAVLIRAKYTDKSLEEITTWHEIAKEVYDSTHGGTAGNGALMRTIYPALWYKHTIEAEEAAVRIGRMTHWHGTSDHTVRAYTEAVHTIVNSDTDPVEARAEMNRIMMVLKGFAGKENRIPAQPTGYCLDSLMCAIDAIDRTDSFEDALIYAVNLGGDADTIGAITGGLAGAIYGQNGIPLRWVNALGNEPNRRTVKLFHDAQGPTAEGVANTLVIRLADLAQTAYQHRKNG